MANIIPAYITWQAEKNRAICGGDWTLHGLVALEEELARMSWPKAGSLTFDGENIHSLDTAGAWAIVSCLRSLQQQGSKVQLEHFDPRFEAMIERVEEEMSLSRTEPRLPERNTFLEGIGKGTVMKVRVALQFLHFIGELVVSLLIDLRKPSRIPWSSVFATIEDTGIRALPIVALLTFLIGIVLAYQMGEELQYYGANIYIVNFSGMAMLREFSPLITAIIVAGRTSSSFTAKIGTMKVNEEIDALRTMGLSPDDWLVIPKVIGLIIAMPLITLWADVFGMLGSMLMSKAMLGINYVDFLSRLHKVIELKTYVLGISKAPFFAVIVGTVGCFHGFQVSHDAESVGTETTRSVVKAIFLIIIADAIFSVMFKWQGIS